MGWFRSLTRKIGTINTFAAFAGTTYVGISLVDNQFPHLGIRKKLYHQYPDTLWRYKYLHNLRSKEFDNANKMCSIVTRPIQENEYKPLQFEKGVRFDHFINKYPEGSPTRACLVMNIGRPRQCKSTNTSIESLLLCETGSRAAIGNKGDHCTLGIDISPPLKPAIETIYPTANMPNDFDDAKFRIVFVDVEGLEGENKRETLKLLEGLIPITSVIVHSYQKTFSDGDFAIRQKIQKMIKDKCGDKSLSQRPQYIVAAVSTLDQLDDGIRWKKIRGTESNMHRSLLPEFGDSDVGDGLKSVVGHDDYPNLLALMERWRHNTKYVDFGKDIAERLMCNTTDLGSIRSAILKWEKLVPELQEVLDREYLLSLEREIPEDIYCKDDNAILKRIDTNLKTVQCVGCETDCKLAAYCCPEEMTVDHPDEFNLCIKCAVDYSRAIWSHT